MTTTHALMCIDMSGSMGHLADDVRGGFNTYLHDLARDGGDYRLTVTLFDTEFISLAVDQTLADTPRLDHTNYRPRGGTALNDAIGKTINDFEAAHGHLGDDEKVLMVIQTDGQENSSREFRIFDVRALIAAKESEGWAFVFLGAGPDAFAQGASYGLGASTIATTQTGAGTRSTYSALSTASGLYSRGASRGATVASVAGAEGVADPNVGK